MAERRMFAKTIIDSDAFLEMPLSTQALYFHLSMRADDDGFINNPKKIQRFIGASEDDLKLLCAKNFIIPFESGIVVIKHWKIHNYIQKDRYKETVYIEEKQALKIKENNAYTLDLNEVYTDCIQDGYSLETQVRLGKDRLGKDSLGEREEKPKKGFTPPTLDEVRAYCEERNNGIDAERFIDFYASKGWMVGKNKMKDWKACVRTWEKRENPKPQPTATKNYDSIFIGDEVSKPPYFGFPREWFNGTDLDESKVINVIRPVCVQKGWIKEEEVTAKELIEKFKIRRTYCESDSI